jgi:hypothetical protein
LRLRASGFRLQINVGKSNKISIWGQLLGNSYPLIDVWQVLDQKIRAEPYVSNMISQAEVTCPCCSVVEVGIVVHLFLFVDLAVIG